MNGKPALQYPPFTLGRSDFARRFHAQAIADPLRALEYHNDPEVHRWALAQDGVAGEYLHKHTDAAANAQWLREHTQAVAPVWRCQRGTSKFYFKMLADKEQPVLYRLRAGEVEQAVLEVNAGAELLHPLLCDVSPSGRFLIYATAPMGAAMVSWQVLDLEVGEVVARSAQASIEPRLAWLPDESGFYYCLCRELFVEAAMPVDGVYFHRLASDPESAAKSDTASADKQVLVYPGPAGTGHIASPYMVPGGGHLVVLTSQFSSGHSGLLVARLDAGGGCEKDDFIRVIDDASCFNRIVGLGANLLYLHSCREAPNGQLVAIDLEQPEPANWQCLVAEQRQALARPEQFISPDKSALVNGQLYLCYVEDAHDIIRHYTLDGSLVRELRPEEFSTVDAVYGIDGDPVIFSQSFLRARAAWSCSDDGLALIAGLSTAPTVAGVEIVQQFYLADDGTRIPLYLLQPAGTAPEQPLPTLLYAYGGFGQTIAPEFTAEACLWLARGGIYALANIRGGGEYGEAWHRAAIAANRQTAFDDFYAAARYLIDAGYTVPAQLAIKGISNGGLLSAVALNQQPELFAAVVSEVPLVDLFWMVESSIGGALSAEYGDPGEDRRVFEAMQRYSPLQNVREHPANPPQLIVVAEQDPSAQPGQIYKYLAARQAVTSASVPVLLRIIYGEGHSHWPWATNCRNLAEQVAFLWHFVAANSSD